MALRETFEEIIEQTRSEARLSTNSSRGIDHLNHIKQIVRRVYAKLAQGFDWEHLRLKRGDATKTMQAGSRYYDFPVNLNVQKIEYAEFYWGNQWQRLGYGIDAEQYNHQNPDNNQRSDPAYRWQWYSNDDLSQFEIWPLPASDTGIVHFLGQKRVNQLVELNDRADIDGLLIALSAAAILLAENEKETAAQEKITEAADLRLMLRGAMSNKARFTIGGKDPKMRGDSRASPRSIDFISWTPR